MIDPSVLQHLDSIQESVIRSLRKRYFHSITTEAIEDAFQSSLLEVLSDTSKEEIRTPEHLRAVLIRKCSGPCYKEQNQIRNDEYIKAGYTGMNLSRHERTVYPEEFISLQSPLQKVLARCLNNRMTYSEINTHLKGEFSGSIGYMRSRYKIWLSSKEKQAPQLSSEDERILRSTKRDPRCIELLNRLLRGEIIGVVAEDLGMSQTTAYNLKYEVIKLIPHIKDLIPIRRNKLSKKLTAAQNIKI